MSKADYKNKPFIFLKSGDYKIWAKVFGDLGSGVTPLLTLHGGPGFARHLINLGKLADQGIPAIVYDQLGCGASDKPNDTGLWKVETFVNEIAEIREQLGLDKVNILGHSWGGALALEYLWTKPKGVEKLILSSPLLDSQLWTQEADRLKDELPENVAKTMRQHEAAGTTASPEYSQAVKIFNSRFVCRLDPWPEELKLSDELASDAVYNTMWGPSEAIVTGNLKNWTAKGKLAQIDTPTLLVYGKYDEFTDIQAKIATKQMPNIKTHVFQNSSHCANFEEEAEYLNQVTEFLS